jgi:hypothetical protein
MQKVSKELIGLTMVLVLAFLILSHSTGFARSIGALSGGYARVVKQLQGQ